MSVELALAIAAIMDTVQAIDEKVDILMDALLEEAEEEEDE